MIFRQRPAYMGTTFESALDSIGQNAAGVVHSIGETKQQAITKSIGETWLYIVGGAIALYVVYKALE